MVTGIQLQGISTEELITDCIAGKSSSQALLYDHFAPRMFGICLRYSNDFHSAEDILQEGFIKVFNNLHRFRNEGSFEGWLKRIFVNTAIEAYRKATRFKEVTDLEVAINFSLDPTVLQKLAQEDLLKLIQKLSVGYRTVFNLYAIEGYSHKEVGKLLNISEGTSKSQLARARVSLQKMIKELQENEEQARQSHR